MTYVGPIKMGMMNVMMDVVYDTGSDWLAVEGSLCLDCDGDTFDGAYSGTLTNTTESERNYGSASLKGFEYKDRVCLDWDICVNDFKYFLISQSKGANGYAGITEPVDGILGMSTGKAPASCPECEIGPLYIEALKDFGMTQQNVFSFYLTDPD